MKLVTVGDREGVPYVSLGSGQFERVLKDLLISLRYRVQLFVAGDNGWRVKSQLRVLLGCRGDRRDVILFKAWQRKMKTAISAQSIHSWRKRAKEEKDTCHKHC